MKELGYWWSDESIEVVEIDGKAIALYGWNGEEYCRCWECKTNHGNVFFDAVEGHKWCVRPIYEEDADGDFEIVGYKLSF